MLLLVSIFETFCTQCLNSKGYWLDPAHFVTAPLLSFQAMLFKNLKAEVVIENISDSNICYDGFLMVKNGIWGGICQVLHSDAKGQYLTVKEAESVLEDPTQLSKEQHILYINYNNLYGTVMCKSIPLDDFRMEKKGGSNDPVINRKEREKALEIMRNKGKMDGEVRKDEKHLLWFDPDIRAVSKHI